MAEKYVRLKIEGMGCEACAERIRESLAAHEAVSGVEVSFHGKEALVTYNDERIGVSGLAGIVQGLGYRVG